MFVRIPAAQSDLRELVACESHAQSAAQVLARLSEIVARERPLELRQHPVEPWIEVRHSGGLRFRVPEASLAARVSQELGTEVVLAQIQTAASVLGLTRFDCGVERRAVEISDGAPWTARGTPEPWEAHLFPPADEVEDLLDESLGDDADPAEREAARRIYAARAIKDGHSHPHYVNSRVFAALTAALGMKSSGLEGFESSSNVTRTAGRPPGSRGRIYGLCLLAVAVLAACAVFGAGARHSRVLVAIPLFGATGVWMLVFGYPVGKDGLAPGWWRLGIFTLVVASCVGACFVLD